MSIHEYTTGATPTTEDVRSWWVEAPYNPEVEGARRAEFDRWLAGVEADVVERCAVIAERLFPLGSPVLGDAPAKIARAIRASMPQLAPKES